MTDRAHNSSFDGLAVYRNILFATVTLTACVSLCAAQQDHATRDVDVRAHSFRHIVFEPENSRFGFYPITNYVNTAFDTAQVSRAFSQSGYWKNHGKVWRRIADPHDRILGDGGYDKFFKQEFASSHVLPNLTLHMLGNGYDFRALAEWFDHYGMPLPWVAAFVTSYAGYFGNEAIERSNYEINASDNIADLYIFNLIGNLMFLSDDLTDLVHNSFQTRNWPGQPVFDAHNNEILNASNNYVMRPRWFGESVRPFLYFGLHYFAGASFQMPDGSSLSVGAGLATKDPFRDQIFDKIQASGGFFWDRDDRLLASLVLNGTDVSAARANFYPPLFQPKDLDIGFFVGVARDATPAFGVSVQKLLAVGFK